MQFLRHEKKNPLVGFEPGTSMLLPTKCSFKRRYKIASDGIRT